MKNAGVVFADSEEDEWKPEDEAKYRELALVEAEVGGDWLIEVPRSIRVDVLPRFPLWRIAGHGEQLILRDALLVTVEPEDGKVLLGSPELRMWGLGPDVFSALEDFSNTFIAVLRSYEATSQDQLTRDAVEYLALLQSLIAPREAS
jgi:hypothetical protein